VAILLKQNISTFIIWLHFKEKVAVFVVIIDIKSQVLSIVLNALY